jgi:hypothetical protein
MSVTFKFDDKGNDPTKAGEKEGKMESVISYPSPSHARSVSFIDKDGNEETLYYSDLYSIKYQPNESMIILYFHQKEVTIKGSELQKLKDMFKSQEIKELHAIDERYAEVSEDKFKVSIAISPRK